MLQSVKKFVKRITSTTYIKNVVRFLEKVGTLLGSRRLIVAVTSFLVYYFGMPESEVKVYVENIGTFFLIVSVILSYAYRPPVGLNYKPVLDLTVDELVEALALKFEKPEDK
jgi:hypothetical protein